MVIWMSEETWPFFSQSSGKMEDCSDCIAQNLKVITSNDCPWGKCQFILIPFGAQISCDGKDSFKLYYDRLFFLKKKKVSSAFIWFHVLGENVVEGKQVMHSSSVAFVCPFIGLLHSGVSNLALLVPSWSGSLSNVLAPVPFASLGNKPVGWRLTLETAPCLLHEET